MAGIIEAPEAVTLAWLLGSAGDIADDELASVVTIAICTDARARADDELPNPADGDRRGWWGDTDADTLHDGWPVGSRLWLLERAKILDAGARQGSTIARVEDYLREALRPLKDKRAASRIAVTVTRAGVNSLAAEVVLFRGREADVSLRFSDLWSFVGQRSSPYAVPAEVPGRLITSDEFELADDAGRTIAWS